MEGVAEQLLRFAHYTLLLGLFGWSAFRIIGLRKLNWLERGSLSRLIALAALAAPLMSAALMLMSIAAMMGVPVLALDQAMAEAMIFGTSMGHAFLIRMVLLAAGLIALLASRKRDSGLVIAAICFAAALFTLGWSGHAAATEGWLGLLHRLNSGIHLVAAGLWLGAIGWFFTLSFRCNELAEARVQELLNIMHNFAPLGVTLVGIVAVTGTVNAQLIFGLQKLPTVIATPYGALLAVKVGLVTAMLAFGAQNARASAPRNSGEGTRFAERGSALIAVRRSLACEFLLGVTVTGLVAVFGMKSPMPM